ncbi:MAG: protein jag [Lachnospiraceae bacterium]|nr:protein jag [Lachnospiraceae bacterium]
MGFIEISAKTADKAIAKACIELKTSSDNLDIQVISEGSAGFLGLGSKPAIIKVRKKDELLDEPVKKSVKEPMKNPENKEKDESIPNEEAFRDYIKKNIPEKTSEEIVMMKASASKFLDAIFKAMDLSVNIIMEYHKETRNMDIIFFGVDMGILIGKRGKTLDSLQYLVNLVVNKDQKSYVRINLDTENYRKRRKETLETLAKNIAYRVRRTGKPFSLETMNSYERRIIHLALQGNKYVETYSEGKKAYRHVVITLKKR